MIVVQNDVLKVVTMQGCSFCVRVKEFLGELKEPYEELDVRSEEGQLVMERTGSRGVPVLIKGSQHVIGFNRDGIMKLLQRV